MKSIQSKILVVVISGLLVITAVVSLIAVNMTHGIMHTDADRILNNATQKEAAYINDTLGDIKKSAAIMEHYAALGVSNVEELRDPEVLANYLEKTKKMFSEIALNTSGIEGYFFRLNPEYTHSKAGYYNIVNDDGTTREMPVTDLYKYDANDGKNVGWYYIPVKAGEAVWLDPYYFPGYDTQLISYATPIYVGNKLVGVIGFDMDFGYILSKIDDISVYEKGYAVLIAKDGETAYNTALHEDSGDPHTKARVALQNGMFLELRADYKDIQHDIHPMLTRIVLAFVIVLLAAIVYTVIVTRKIVKPLKQLTAWAEALSLGQNADELENAPINSKDEVGTLAQVLRSTYEKIQEYTAYIDALAHRDSLTGVKNSLAYSEAVAELNKEINHTRPAFGVLVADINNLKLTNDKYGHDIGNALIVRAAKILSDTFKNCPIFRIGGDEFVVVLKGKDYDNYRSLLTKLDNAYSKEAIPVSEDETIPVSVARGVATFDSEIDHVYEDVFAKADHAMYLNKSESKAART